MFSKLALAATIINEIVNEELSGTTEQKATKCHPQNNVLSLKITPEGQSRTEFSEDVESHQFSGVCIVICSVEYNSFQI